jgi:hypothetical protein
MMAQCYSSTFKDMIKASARRRILEKSQLTAMVRKRPDVEIPFGRKQSFDE